MSSSRPPLILGSSSPRRRELLASIGVVPDDIRPADIDETPMPGELPRQYAMRMSRAKAAALTPILDVPSYLLVGDTVVCVGRRILSKALTRADGAQCLDLLSGRRGRVYSSVTLIEATRAGALKATHRCVCTIVAFASMTASQKSWLLDTNDWYGKSGGFALQGYSARFIRYINGSPSNVIGLPLFETSQLLRGLTGNPFGL